MAGSGFTGLCFSAEPLFLGCFLGGGRAAGALWWNLCGIGCVLKVALAWGQGQDGLSDLKTEINVSRSNQFSSDLLSDSPSFSAVQ